MMPGVYNKACTTSFSGELQLETWIHMERFHAAEQQVEESFVVFHSLGTKTVDDVKRIARLILQTLKTFICSKQRYACLLKLPKLPLISRKY
jgi:hypothetical protein